MRETIDKINSDYPRFLKATIDAINKALETKTKEEVQSLISKSIFSENIQVAMLKNDGKFIDFLKQKGLKNEFKI